MCNLTRIKNLSRFVVIVVLVVVWHEKWPSFFTLRIRNVCVNAVCISSSCKSCDNCMVRFGYSSPLSTHLPSLYFPLCAPLQRALHAFSYSELPVNCFTHRLSHCSQGFFVSSKSLPSSLLVVVVVVVIVLTNSGSYCKRCYCQCHYYLLLSLLFFLLLLLIFVVIFHLMFFENVCEVFFPLFCSISVWCL